MGNYKPWGHPTYSIGTNQFVTTIDVLDPTRKPIILYKNINLGTSEKSLTHTNDMDYKVPTGKQLRTIVMGFQYTSISTGISVGPSLSIDTSMSAVYVFETRDAKQGMQWLPFFNTFAADTYVNVIADAAGLFAVYCLGVEEDA